jgi:hypothetical protein
MKSAAPNESDLCYNESCFVVEKSLLVNCICTSPLSPPKSPEFSTKLLGRFREFVGVFWLDFEDPPPIPRRPCDPPPFLFSSFAGTQHLDFWQLGASISGAFGQPEEQHNILMKALANFRIISF